MNKYQPIECPSIVTDFTGMTQNEFKYSGHPITQWARQNDWADNLLYSKSASNQRCFVRDELCEGLKFNRGDVIGTHTSKSVLLPVYRLEWGPLQIVLRDNFHGWNMSVNSPIEMELPIELFDKESDGEYGYCSCEGFPAQWILEQYRLNKNRFTISVRDKYRLFTLIYLMKKQVSKE